MTSNPYLLTTNKSEIVSSDDEFFKDAESKHEDQGSDRNYRLSTSKKFVVKSINVEFVWNNNELLNRSLILPLHVYQYPIPVSILYNKKSPNVEFQLDHNIPAIKEKLIYVDMYRCFSHSNFAKVFLKLESVSDEVKHYTDKLVGFDEKFGRYLVTILKETYDLQTQDNKKYSNNCINLIAWKIMDVDNDLVFLYVQRKIFMETTRILVSRSYGLQLATEKGLDCLKKYRDKIKD